MLRFGFVVSIVIAFSVVWSGPLISQSYATDRPQDALAVQLANQGRYAEAEALLRRTLAQDRANLGPTHPNTVDTTENLAVVLDILGRPDEAEPLHRLVLQTRRKHLGPNSPATLRAMSNLGTTLRDLNRFLEAVEILDASIAGSNITHGETAPETLARINMLGHTLLRANQPERAEQVLRRAVELGGQTLGEDNAEVLSWSVNLALALDTMARFEDANALNARIIAGLSRRQGPTSPRVLTAKNNFGFSLMSQGRMLKAVPLFTEVLNAHEQTLGPQHPQTMTARIMLGNALSKLGRGDEALALRRRDLDLMISSAGPEHVYTVRAMRNYASALEAVGRLADAQTIRQRVLAISRKTNGERSEDTLIAMNDVALDLMESGQVAQARELMERALDGFVGLYGAAHPRTVESAINLAAIQAQAGDSEAVIALLRDIRKHLGTHPHFGPVEELRLAFNLSSTLHDAGLPLEAAQELEGMIPKADAVYGPTSVRPQLFRLRLAESSLSSGSFRKALHLSRHAHSVLSDRLRRTGNLTADEQRVALEQASRAAWAFIQASWAVSQRADKAEADQLARDAFEAAQTIGLGPSAFAISRAAGRIAADNARVEPFLNDWIGAKRDLAAFETKSVAAASGAETSTVAAPDTLDRLMDRLDTTTQALQNAFPAFFDLINPRVVRVTDFLPGGDAELDDDEALILIVPEGGNDRSTHFGPGFVWAVTREGVTWSRLEFDATELEARVSALRRSINPDEEFLVAARAPINPSGPEQQDSTRRFDIELAHDLFLDLFGAPEISEAIAPKKRWLIAPQSSLLSLPFGALATAPQKEFGSVAKTLRNTRWLGVERALSVIPSLQLALRDNTSTTARADTRVSYVGFGDPDFYGTPEPLRLETRNLHRSAQDLREGLKNLPRLPGTRTEILSLASQFGAGEHSVFLGSRANESELRKLDASGQLRQTRVLHFATHGLISGDFDNLDEPALALSPPPSPDSPKFDGLLTASEAATLSLDTEWVLLSACNTAAGAKPGAEGLSGLARAFFFAGARNLLVTHWPVRDDLTSRLITEVVTPSTERVRSEALRQEIEALIQDTSEDHRERPLAHPGNWAGFQLVGAG